MGDQDDGFAYRTDRPVEELRQELEDLAAGWTLAEGTTFDLVNCGGTPCEWIRATCKAESKLEGAVYFHMHGGGHYRGSSRVAAPVCSHISGLAGIDCLSVNYRVAPEHKWPVAVDDVYAAYTWLTGQTRPEKIVIGGDSAGGDLAFALLVKLRDNAPELLPAGAIGMSPWVDLTQSGGTFVTNADTGVANCDKTYLDHWSAEYLGDADPVEASPLFADLTGLPPMLIQCGGGETMLDDSVELAAKAARARCQVALEIYDMQGHVFQNDYDNPAAVEAVDAMVAFVRKEISRAGSVPSQRPRL